ncbi:MAG: HPF/RaiA family ribosome-associated protein [Minisyncoccia bacterium]
MISTPQIIVGMEICPRVIINVWRGGLLFREFLVRIKINNFNMRINIYTQNFELLNIQKEYIEKKMLALEKFTKRFNREIDLDIYLVQVSKHHQEGNIFTIEAKLKLPGKDIFCKKEGSSIQEIVEMLKDELKRLIVKIKKTQQSKWKKI